MARNFIKSKQLTVAEIAAVVPANIKSQFNKEFL
jgi:hypothetical protein